MTTRLQVLLEEEELAEIREIARRQRTTVSEWVRQALRSARRQQPRAEIERKLAAVRAAVGHDHPTADVDVMIQEIERGYEIGERG